MQRFFLILSLLLLAACGALTPAGSPDGGAAAPMLQVAQSPADVVRAFLDHWNAKNRQGMYDLLSAASRGLITYAVFDATYADAEATLAAQGVTYNLKNTLEQGSTAVVAYDAAIQSSLFGEIIDADHTIRLVRDSGGVWRIAWTQMDILSGYAPGTRLVVESRLTPRGGIYDRRGQVMVEQDSDVIEIYVAAQDMGDFDGCIDLLATLLRLNRADLIAQINGYNPDTVFPIGDMDPEIYDAWQNDLTALCSARINTRETRRYVGHGIATHLVGYVGNIPAEQLESYQARGYTSDDLVGLLGVEAAYETELAGSPERIVRILEPGGLIVRELAGTSGEASRHVALTLDLNLQWTAAQALSDAYNYAGGNWAAREHSPGGGLVAIDVNTGAILAFASYPSFDPGIFNPDTPIFFVGDYISALRNDARNIFAARPSQEQYSPGSTFKIVTLAAAAEEQLMQPDALFDCGMEWRGQAFGDTFERRLDWRATEVLEEARFATGQVTMSEALASSCNPFFYQMGARLFGEVGPATLMEYARRMGFGRASGLSPIVPEAAGQLPLLRTADAAISAAVGQYDTQVTLLQMAQMVAAIANGGDLFQPYVVQRVGGGDSRPPLYEAAPQIAGQLGLSETALNIVRDGMCMVTTQQATGRSTGKPLGTAWFVFDEAAPNGTGIAPYTVCGKTGTAQTGRIEPNGWFVAFAPRENPEIAVVAMIEHGREGSETAAPIVRRVLDAYFNAPQAPYPVWWFENEYVALNIPEGSTGG
ncbi:MAG: hypothetical protein L6Q98_16015 [Anaerolineae bacterium]|nr:hypothetical protein [Anaerolineae bacterium]NUQ06003.1 hypothetical protein [Anaerolineae bacterium]